MALVSPACDLCAGNSFATLYESNLAEGEARDYYSSSRTTARHHRIVHCLGCGLVQSNPRDDDQTLQTIYAHLEDPIYQRERENRRKIARNHLRLVTHYAPKTGRLLDIGCASGIFLAEAASQGWQVSGLEPSEWHLQQARQLIPGAQFIHGRLEETIFSESQFDVITLWDVLEHLPSPTQALRRLHPWLSPKGLVFLNLPNIESWAARLMGTHWVLLLREHLWYFSPLTVKKLLETTGFELLRLQSNWVQFSVENILERLTQYGKRMKKPAREFTDRSILKRLSFRFPMGEMTVIAQKTPS